MFLHQRMHEGFDAGQGGGIGGDDALERVAAFVGRRHNYRIVRLARQAPVRHVILASQLALATQTQLMRGGHDERGKAMSCDWV